VLHLGPTIRSGRWAVLLVACLVGLVPESGPNLIFVTLFAQGLIPFSVLVANSIVQDGHGMLPMLAHSRREFLLIRTIAFAAALMFGSIALSAGIVKEFPGGKVGGPKFVQALKGPCPWVSVPTAANLSERLLCPGKYEAGNPQAPLTATEFGDLESPLCGRDGSIMRLTQARTLPSERSYSGCPRLAHPTGFRLHTAESPARWLSAGSRGDGSR
jgi:Putative, 10TM heavy-metal exporter